MAFPGELFPSLIELHAYDFGSIQLAAMNCLRKVEIHNTPSYQISEKDFHSQLKSFSYLCYGDPGCDESFLWVLKHATRLSEHCTSTGCFQVSG
jgi:hypothetical protein